MKELLEKLAWKNCQINTVNYRFDNAKILEVSGSFILIETENKEKVLLNLQFVRNIIELKEGSIPPVFVPRDL